MSRAIRDATRHTVFIRIRRSWPVRFLHRLRGWRGEWAGVAPDGQTARYVEDRHGDLHRSRTPWSSSRISASGADR